MIPRAYITAWRAVVPWPEDYQIEQDLILSRTLVEIFSEPAIADNFALRGGTALHKIYIQPQTRYSEDIDLVQREAMGIGSLINTLRAKLVWLGEPRRKQTENGVTLIYNFNSEIMPILKLRLKLEINTREHFSVLGFEKKLFRVDNPWFTQEARIITYQLDELLATKLRALYQRKKGRDLFDLWLAIDRNLINPVRLVECFTCYMEHEQLRISRQEFEKNLTGKMEDPVFTQDITPLLAGSNEYDIQIARQIVWEKIVSLLPS